MGETCLSAAASRAAIGLLPKERRIRKRADFDKIFKFGRVLKRPDVRVVWSPGTGRAAVVVAKSIGSIAYRNTIKRRWREALGEAELPNALDVIFVVRSEGAKERGEVLKQSLKAALSELPA